MPDIREEVTRYSAALGSNPLLIQGAGGNVSWKDEEELWIKASGTWLSEALDRDIFVGLDLQKAKRLAVDGANDYLPAVLDGQALRPSIETALHALLPQAVVVHCHAVDLIAHTLVAGGRARIERLLDGIDWAWIDYVKPGPELAAAVYSELAGRAAPPDVLVLANHGLVIAGNDVGAIDARLQDVLRRTAITVIGQLARPVESRVADAWLAAGYRPSGSAAIQLLATDPEMLALARTRWVLYPDHAVFLGAFATVCAPTLLPSDFLGAIEKLPACVIVPGVDVMIAEAASAGQRLMIACYADILCRLPDKREVTGLSSEQVAALLDWDAEKYRQQLNISSTV